MVKLVDHLPAYAAAEHPAEGETARIHCHILIYGFPGKTESLRRKFEKLFPDLNGDARRILNYYKDRQKVKHLVDRKGLVYILKGQKERLKSFNGFTEQEIDEAVAAWVEYPSNKTANSSNKKVIDLSGNKTDWQIIQDMVTEIQSLPVLDIILNYDEQGNVCNMKKWTQNQISTIISKHLHLNKKKTSVHDAQRWLGTVLRTLDGHREDFWNAVWERFSKRIV